MAVASVPWPSFEEATLSDWAPIGALLCAIDERRAVADAVNGTSATDVESFGWTGLGPGVAPTRAALDSIRDAICALCGIFVFPDDEAHRANGFTTFPVRTIASNGENWFPPDMALPLCGEHSIADPPDPGSGELDPNTLQRYRSWLLNCAWWLERLRYLDASSVCRYTRKATIGYYSVWTDPDEDHWIDQDENPAAPIGESITINLTIEEDEEGYPAMSPSYIHLDGSAFAYDSCLRGEDYCLGLFSKDHTIEGGEFYSGLVADNPAALNTRLLLVPTPNPCAPAVARTPIRIVWECSTESEPWRAPDTVTEAHWCIDSFVQRSRKESFVGGEWRRIKETTRTYEATGNDPDSNWRWEEDVLGIDWAPDGSASAGTTRSHSYGTTQDTIDSLLNSHPIPVFGIQFEAGGFNDGTFEFDSFGEGVYKDRNQSDGIEYELGVPVVAAIVSAHAEYRSENPGLCPHDAFPLPNRWLEFREHSDGIATRGPRPSHRTDVYDFKAIRTLVPIFDYGPYFAYGRSAA